jgi:hypothetical protein
MRSEYDFLAPLSGPLRRTGTLLAAGAAFVAGMICTGLVVALTMKPVDEGQALFTAASERSVPASLTAKSTGQAKVSATGIGAVAAPAPTAQPDQAKPKVVTRSLAGERTETTGQSLAPSAPVQATEPVQATALPTPAKPAEPPAAAAPEPRAQVATDGEARADKPRKRIKRARAPRSQAREARRRGDDREAPRQYVDQFGRRTVVVPRRWDDTDGRAWARERAYDRGSMFGPGPYYGRY